MKEKRHSALLKTSFSLLFLLFFFGFGHAQHNQALDNARGILGYLLEATPDSMPGKLKGLGKTRKLSKYRPEPDSVYFDGVFIHSLRLFFFQNQLHSIVLKTLNDAETDKVMKLIVKRFGPGKPEDQFEGILSWQGKRVYLRFEKNYVSSEGVFSFYSYKINRLYEIAEYNRVYEDE